MTENRDKYRPFNHEHLNLQVEDEKSQVLEEKADSFDAALNDTEAQVEPINKQKKQVKIFNEDMGEI